MEKLFLYVSATLLFCGSALANTTFSITHGPTPAPTILDMGQQGDSVGDVRIWRFSAKSSDNQDVMMDWLMTTTGYAAHTTELESRVTLSVVSFDDKGKDTIQLQGVGLYPIIGSTLKSEDTLERAVIGGTGKYVGASGSVTSTHLTDGSWQHVFHLE
ncbi:MAG: hypothetical protein P8J79_04785 [Halioglobus sp.]|nr:hypothetical protein [Halioglobus sp.]